MCSLRHVTKHHMRGSRPGGNTSFVVWNTVYSLNCMYASFGCMSLYPCMVHDRIRVCCFVCWDRWLHQVVLVKNIFGEMMIRLNFVQPPSIKVSCRCGMYVRFPHTPTNDSVGASVTLHKTMSGTEFNKTVRQLHLNDYETRHKAADKVISRKDVEAIVPVLRSVVSISDTIGQNESHDWAFDQLGRCLGKIGKHGESLDAHLKELDVAIRFRNKVEEGHACCNVARAYAGLQK